MSDNTNTSDVIDSIANSAIPTDEQAVAAMQETDSLEETASMMFGLYYPKFELLVNTLSNKSLRRLIKAMVAVPLETANVNLKIENERVAYAICEKLMISKFGLVINTLWKYEQKTKNEETNLTKKENENG